jgi:hypothetical protein
MVEIREEGCPGNAHHSKGFLQRGLVRCRDTQPHNEIARSRLRVGHVETEACPLGGEPGTGEIGFNEDDPRVVREHFAYYFEHREEIDKSIEEGRAFVEAMRKSTPSKLGAKLQEQSE